MKLWLHIYNVTICNTVISFFSADYVKVVNMNGKLKSSRKQAAELHFDFQVESIGEKTLLKGLLAWEYTGSH